MYVPGNYRVQDQERLLAFLRLHNFAALVTYDGEKPIATHTPVELVESKDAMTIYGHIARANSQRLTFNGQEALVVFQGPNTYISPRWYDHVNVPTWNYQIVHLYGRVREVTGDDLYSLLSRIVQKHESGSSYRLERLPRDFVERKMKGVSGFAVDVTRIDASYKLSQNRNDQDYDNIVANLTQRGDDNSERIAEAMREERPRSGSAH